MFWIGALCVLAAAEIVILCIAAKVARREAEAAGEGATLSDVALTWLVLSVTLIASLAWVWPPSTSTR